MRICGLMRKGPSFQRFSSIAESISAWVRCSLCARTGNALRTTSNAAARLPTRMGFVVNRIWRIWSPASKTRTPEPTGTPGGFRFVNFYSDWEKELLESCHGCREKATCGKCGTTRPWARRLDIDLIEPIEYVGRLQERPHAKERVRAALLRRKGWRRAARPASNRLSVHSA